MPWIVPAGSARKLLATAVLAASLAPAGCESNGPWPRAAKGYIDADHDGVRELKEYVEPTDEFTEHDTILFVNRVHGKRIGETLRIFVWAPDGQTLVFEARTMIGEMDEITHYRVPARQLTDKGGFGSYLVNWRIGDDTIEAYTIMISPASGEAPGESPPPDHFEPAPSEEITPLDLPAAVPQSRP